MQTEELEVRWHWRELQLDLACHPTEEPDEPEIGMGWFNAALNCLCIWDGVEWICVPLD